MDNSRLSRAIAEVIRRELAGRQIDGAEFAAHVGMSKTTGWRKIQGKSKMTIDDVMAFAEGLGWTLPQLMARAEATIAAGGSVDPVDAQLEAKLSPGARRVVEEERARVRREHRGEADAEDPPDAATKGRRSA